MLNYPLKKGLNGNLIKILAIIFMTIDHVGLVLFENNLILRSIGRLSYPLFAFMLAEGCFYTKNKLKHFLLVFILALVCQITVFVYSGEVQHNILITFSMAILVIYAYQVFENNKTFISSFPLVISILVVYGLNYIIPSFTKTKGFNLDYRFMGAMLPLLIYMFKDFRLKLLVTAIGLVLLSLELGSIQWFSLLSLIILSFYDGKKGKLKLKYMFYIYYPLHLLLIYGISLILGFNFY